MKKNLTILLFMLVTLCYSQVPTRPSPQRLYNNLSKEFPDFLNTTEAAQLEEKLQVFSNETSNQICVVILDDLNGEDASSLATKIGNEWGVGKKDKNNGIVILVKPTKTGGGRDLFISTGYGLEGAIPDLATARIRDEEMQPYLKAGEYYAALDRGTDVLMKLAKGEINVKDYTRQPAHTKHQRSPLTLIIIIFVIIFIIRSFFGGGGGGRTFSGVGRSIFWGSMLGGGFGGGRGFGGGGGGGFGGGGGGGWGGFGGGSFGGGGSGGKW